MSAAPDLEKRLDALPRKVAQPLRQLFAVGHLNEDVLSTILDAGECAGDRARLLGFAAGYLHLRSQHIPVHDVIRMAKEQGRRINLGWSAKRWSAEHDRLSRAEALARLAKENVSYDLSKYDALVPAEMKGKLIRTSRRLGMEGLRQRHCVASYDGRIKAGHCAIASVIADRQRWTVQLVATGNSETPLRIDQIKTRHNGLPSGKVRDCVHKMFGVDPARKPARQMADDPAERTYMDTLRRLLPVLEQNGVNRVTVSFDGYGDDGSIDGIWYDSAEEFDGRAVNVEHEEVTRHFNDGQWITEREHVNASVTKAIDELTYDYLEETGVDWVNDEGGFGELVIDVVRGTVALDVNVRTVESCSVFCTERDILTEEDVYERARGRANADREERIPWERDDDRDRER